MAAKKTGTKKQGGVLGVGDIDNNDDPLAGLDPDGKKQTEEGKLSEEFGKELDQSGSSGRVAPKVTKKAEKKKKG